MIPIIFLASELYNKQLGLDSVIHVKCVEINATSWLFFVEETDKRDAWKTQTFPENFRNDDPLLQIAEKQCGQIDLLTREEGNQCGARDLSDDWD